MGMITCCCTFPVIFAILPLQGAWRTAYTETAALSGIVGGVLCLSLYGCWRTGWRFEGLWVAWYGNNYAWDYFLIATVVPAVVAVVWAGAQAAANKTKISAEASRPPCLP